MKPSLILGLTAGLAFSSQGMAIDQTLSFLDFENKIDNGDILFAPFKGSDRGTGYVWFRQYELTFRPPTPGSQPKSIMVSMAPKATQTQQFNEFAAQHSITPERKYLIPDTATLCQASETLTQLLDQFSYQTLKVYGQSFPKLCSLSIRYIPQTDEQEQALLAMLERGEGVVSAFEIQSPQAPSQTQPINVPQLVLDLRNNGVLTAHLPSDNQQHGWQGDIDEIGFYSARQGSKLYGFAQSTPDLAQWYRHWQQWMGLFQLDASSQQWVIRESDATQPLPTQTNQPGTAQPIIQVAYP